MYKGFILYRLRSLREYETQVIGGENDEGVRFW